jgi:hypothetical protein
MAELEFCPTGFDDEEWMESPSSSAPWRTDNRGQLLRMLEALWQAPSGDPTLSNVEIESERPLEERFRQQADKWEQETRHLSSPTQRIMHPSYQAVLGLGREHKEEVIRLLLRDMQQNRRAWFWALSYLAGDNPIGPADAGKMDKMIGAWIKWGRAKGLL